MATSPTPSRRPNGDDADTADAFIDAFSAGVYEQPTPALQTLFISAVVECPGPVRVRRFVRRLGATLDATGRVDDDAQLAQWRWLVMELRLMEELDTKRFDDPGVRALLAQLETRIEGRNDPTVVLEIDGAVEEEEVQANPSTEDGDASLSWDAMAKSIRDSSRQTLRRLLSGSGSAPESRDSVSSTDFPTDTSVGSRRSRQQQHTQTSNSDDGGGIAMLQRNSSAVSDSLVWSISSRIGMNMEETFLCQICYENVPVVDAAELTACKHRFCKPCIKTYLELKIVDGQVYPVCFHETDQSLTTVMPVIHSADPDQSPPAPPPRKACGALIAPCDIEALVTPDEWKKYLMFKFNKENEYGRQCPYCAESQVCAGPEHPECVCTACDKPFCFTHGNAHADDMCADFEMRQAEADKLNRSAIAEISKPCPGCKSNVEKSGGCNHMKCIVCSTDFCWICGAIVDSNVAPLHFQWWNVRGCAGQQMEDVDAQSPSERFWMGVVRIFMVVFLGPPAFVITVALTLASCCCVPCMAALQLSFRDLFTSCLNFIVISLLLILTGVCVAVTFICAFVWEVICYPFQRLRMGCCSPSPSTEGTATSTSDEASVA